MKRWRAIFQLCFFLVSITFLRYFLNIKPHSNGNQECSKEPNMTQVNAILRDLELQGCDDPLRYVNIGNKSENSFAQGFRSQFGQDQWIQSRIFSRLPPIRGYFVEFGARDGIEHSRFFHPING
jgi:hypothetical protein